MFNHGRTVRICRMCKSKNLELFLDMGHHPHSDHYLTSLELEEPEVFYPLSVYSCQDCGLAQLGYVVSQDILYRKDYLYEASITRTGREHYKSLADAVCKRFGFDAESLAIDIGSNVGVLLAGFKDRGLKVLGVDPAKNIAAIANDGGIETLPSFFTSQITSQIVKKMGRADVITATNVFAHIGDLDDFQVAIDNQLSHRGVFIIEAPWFLDLLNGLEYDTIYHQHLGYLSVKPMTQFFNRFGFELFDVERVKIHGGTLRYFVSRKGVFPVSENVQKFIKREESEGAYSMERLRRFTEDVRRQRKSLLDLLFSLKKSGKKIVALSAPAKGNTLLNYCKIDSNLLDYLTEKSKFKIGRFSPGMHIPIFGDEKILQDRPDYALVLAWNFADEIMENMAEFKSGGGKFIIPIPEPKII